MYGPNCRCKGKLQVPRVNSFVFGECNEGCDEWCVYSLKVARIFFEIFFKLTRNTRYWAKIKSDLLVASSCASLSPRGWKTCASKIGKTEACQLPPCKAFVKCYLSSLFRRVSLMGERTGNCTLIKGVKMTIGECSTLVELDIYSLSNSSKQLIRRTLIFEQTVLMPCN